MPPGRRPSTSTRLGRYIDERADELGLKLAEVAQRAHLSPEALRLIRNGTTTELQSRTKNNLEGALKWAPGSIDAIQAHPDGRPTPRSIDEAPTPTRPAVEAPVDPRDEQLALPLLDDFGDPIRDEDGVPLTMARILGTIRYVTRQEGVEAGRRALRDMGNRFGLPLAHDVHVEDELGEPSSRQVG